MEESSDRSYLLQSHPHLVQQTARPPGPIGPGPHSAGPGSLHKQIGRPVPPIRTRSDLQNVARPSASPRISPQASPPSHNAHTLQVSALRMYFHEALLSLVP